MESLKNENKPSLQSVLREQEQDPTTYPLAHIEELLFFCQTQEEFVPQKLLPK